jgi:hypothetical protein
VSVVGAGVRAVVGANSRAHDPATGHTDAGADDAREQYEHQLAECLARLFVAEFRRRVEEQAKDAAVEPPGREEVRCGITDRGHS